MEDTDQPDLTPPAEGRRPPVRQPAVAAPPPESPVQASRKGAQLGNLNGAKNAWATYWRRRALRPEQRWVLALVADYVPQLVADKGGDESVSHAERKVMELAAVARACWALAMAAGNLEAVARFVNIERQALSDLGLERRAKPVLSLKQYLVQAEAAQAAAQHVGDQS